MEEELNQVKRCLNPKCNKIIDGKKRSNYCSETCRTRHSSYRQYQKLKNNEEFRKKRNLNNLKYYEENKEILKPKMRVYGMKYFFRKRDERKLEEEKKKFEKEQIKKEETKDEHKGEGIESNTDAN